MKNKKLILNLFIAFGLLSTTQMFKQSSEAKIGSWLATKVTKNVNAQRGLAAAAGVTGGMAGRWAGAKVGAAIGSAIAPGVGTIIGAGVGAL